MDIKSKLDKISQALKVSSTYEINKIPLTTTAFMRLLDLDEKLVETRDYMGLAYFWAHSVKHYLREASPIQRKKIHDALLKAGKQLVEDNPDDEYLAIIKKYMRVKD